MTLDDIEWLFRLHAAALHERALKFTRGRQELADEIMSRLWLRTVEKAHQFNDPATAKGWLFTVLKTMWLNYLRGENRHRSTVSLDDIPFEPKDERDDIGQRIAKEHLIDLTSRYVSGKQMEVLEHEILGDWEKETVLLTLSINERHLDSALSKARYTLRRNAKLCFWVTDAHVTASICIPDRPNLATLLTNRRSLFTCPSLNGKVTEYSASASTDDLLDDCSQFSVLNDDSFIALTVARITVRMDIGYQSSYHWPVIQSFLDLYSRLSDLPPELLNGAFDYIWVRSCYLVRLEPDSLRPEFPSGNV